MAMVTMLSTRHMLPRSLLRGTIDRTEDAGAIAGAEAALSTGCAN